MADFFVVVERVVAIADLTLLFGITSSWVDLKEYSLSEKLKPCSKIYCSRIILLITRARSFYSLLRFSISSLIC